MPQLRGENTEACAQKMSFQAFVVQYKWVLLFYAAVALLVYLNRRKFDVEAKFLYLYRTKVGLRLIESLSRFKRTIQLISKIGIAFGIAGLVWIVGFIGYRTYTVILEPKTIGVAPVLPGLPIAGTGVEFPLIMGWIALFIIIVIHEASHGVVARAFQVKIKSSGIAFFGPILAAFVEPDEKALAKESGTVQNAVMAAGPFANVVTSVIFFLLLAFVLAPVSSSLTHTQGMMVSPIEGTPAYAAGLPNSTIIVSINNASTKDIEAFLNAPQYLKPNSSVVLVSLEGERYEFRASEHPDNSSAGYMGIMRESLIQEPLSDSIAHKVGFHLMKWLSELFFWLYFISLNLGLINLFPIFITDGARILHVMLQKLIKDKQGAIVIWKLINQVCILMLLMLMLLPWIRSLIGLF
jgi:membrane-associated protease RseP (regulator of RpoE activity)